MNASDKQTSTSFDESDIAAAFYAGRYHDVLRRTIDSRDAGSAPEDGGFVIGALAFVGRLEEAELLLDRWRRAHDRTVSTIAAGGFFVCVALCRSGRLDRAVVMLQRTASDTRGHRDARSYALLHQGAACCRYFRAEYAAAARAATRALASAQVARFAYGQMLANDMRGHLMLQRGRFHDGLAVLQRARDQALQLGFTSNAHAIEISMGLQRARLEPPDRAMAMLDQLVVRETTHDSYSRRAVLLEQAVLLAWCGRASAADDLVEREIAPRCSVTDARARAALFLIRAQVARVRHGFGAARALAAAALVLVRDRVDVVREAEAWSLELAAAADCADRDAIVAAERQLRDLAQRTGVYRAAAALAIHDNDSTFEAESDEMQIRLAAIARGDVHVAFDSGLLGLLPEALRLAPSKRIHTFDHATVVENHGDIVALPPLSTRALALLRAVARTPSDRETLFGEVWGLGKFDPERHGSLVKTTVSRLRASLGPAGTWLVTTGGFYAIDESVALFDHCADAAPRDSQRRDRAPAEDTTHPSSRARSIVSLLRRRGQVSASDVAFHLHTSIRTASRELSTMHAQHIVGRSGAGRGTRYFLSHDASAGAERP